MERAGSGWGFSVIAEQRRRIDPQNSPRTAKRMTSPNRGVQNERMLSPSACVDVLDSACKDASPLRRFWLCAAAHSNDIFSNLRCCVLWLRGVGHCRHSVTTVRLVEVSC